MNIWERMELSKNDFTPKEMEIYELVLKDPYLCSTSTAMNLAARFGIAQSAISRFCQKIGFSGFSDFRMSMTLATSMQVKNLDVSSNDGSSEKDYTYYLCDSVKKTRSYVSDKILDSLATHIQEASNIFTSGYGASNIAAQLLSLRLLVAGKSSRQLPPSIEMETLRIMKPTDLVFLFSASNPSHRDFLSLAFDMNPERRPYIVLITNAPRHPLRSKVTEVITLPNWSFVEDPYLIDYSFYQITFCELLYEHVTRKL